MYRRDAIFYKDLSEDQNVQIYDVECNSETDQLTFAESLLLECENYLTIMMDGKQAPMKVLMKQ